MGRHRLDDEIALGLGVRMRYIAKPSNPFAFHYEVEVDGIHRGFVRHRAFRTGGRAGWDGDELTITRIALMSYEISSGHGSLASIRRAGLLRWSSSLEWPGGSAELQAAFFRFRTDFIQDGQSIGSIRPRHLLTRTLVVEAPDDLPAAAVLLAVWAAIRRRRQAAGAAAGG